MLPRGSISVFLEKNSFKNSTSDSNTKTHRNYTIQLTPNSSLPVPFIPLERTVTPITKRLKKMFWYPARLGNKKREKQYKKVKFNRKKLY
jgi:hypothetical protein